MTTGITTIAMMIAVSPVREDGTETMAVDTDGTTATTGMTAVKTFGDTTDTNAAIAATAVLRTTGAMSLGVVPAVVPWTSQLAFAPIPRRRRS